MHAGLVLFAPKLSDEGRGPARLLGRPALDADLLGDEQTAEELKCLAALDGLREDPSREVLGALVLPLLETQTRAASKLVEVEVVLHGALGNREECLASQDVPFLSRLLLSHHANLMSRKCGSFG